MKETLPNTLTEQHDKSTETPKYSPDELEQLTSASHGAEDVLERAISAGEPRHKVVETDGGIKGFVEAGIPGGRVEATFDGAGESARLEEIDMILGDDDGSHMVGIRFEESGDAFIFIDGEPVNPEEVPAVAAVIEQLKAEQEESPQEAEEKKTKETDEIQEEPQKPEKTEQEKRNAIAYKSLIMPYLSGPNAGMVDRALREIGVDVNETKKRIMTGDVTVDSNTMAAMNTFKARVAQPGSPIWREDPRGRSQLASAAAESHQLLREVIGSALR